MNSINLIITNLPKQLLGYAGLPGKVKNKDDEYTNYLFISPDSIGCPSVMGKSKLYGQGKTLVHEMGHVLGLLHPFDSDEWVTDTPPQQKSNLNCELSYYKVQNRKTGESETTWKAKKINNTFYKKLPHDERRINPLSLGYAEMFCNFMEYSPDKYMWMFTRDQVCITAYTIEPY